MTITDHQVSELIGMYKGLASIYDNSGESKSTGISDYVTEKNMLKSISGLAIKQVLVTETVKPKWARLLNDMGFEVSYLLTDPDEFPDFQHEDKKNGNPVRIVNKSIEELIYDNYSFDLIFAEGGLISVSEEPAECLKKFKKLTSPGGYIWFDYLNLMGWSMIQPDVEVKVQLAAKEEESIYMGKNEYPFRLFMPKRIRYMLYDAGFLELNEFGIGILTNPLIHDNRINRSEIAKIRKLELELSRNYNLSGSAFRIQVLAQKIIR